MPTKFPGVSSGNSKQAQRLKKVFGSKSCNSLATRGLVKVAFIAAPYGGASQGIAPLGAMAVASYVKAKLGSRIESKVYDFSERSALELSELDRVISDSPDVVAFPLYTSNLQATAEWARHLALRLPYVILVAGGAHVTLSGVAFVQRWGHLYHYCISGEGERPFLSLMTALLTGSEAGLVNVPGISFLSSNDEVVNGGENTKPLPPGEWADPLDCDLQQEGEPPVFFDPREGRPRRAVALVSSRSCPLRCSFCAIVAMRAKWQAASSEAVVRWLLRKHHEIPFEHVSFMDANFFVKPTRVRELIGLLAKALPGVTWNASSTVGMLLRMRDDVGWLVENGLRSVELGLESGSTNQLKFLKKKATVQENLEAIQLLQQHNLHLGLDYIMFYPDQTLDELRENLIFLRQAHLTQHGDTDHYLGALQLYPGTPVRTLFENRRGAPFDIDELPNPISLFSDPDVRAVYIRFIEEFAPRYLQSIATLDVDLRAAGAGRSRLAQRMRLEAVLMRHVPFKVLWALTDAPRANSLQEAVPWLKKYDRFEQNLRRILSYSETKLSDTAA